MAEVKDVAPTVLNTVQMSIKYGESAFKDGQHLGKAQVRPLATAVQTYFRDQCPAPSRRHLQASWLFCKLHVYISLQHERLQTRR